MKTTQKTGCSCNSNACPNKEETNMSLKKTVNSIPSIMLSVVVAFFPKCPICWAVYMSMLGSFGIVEIPYLKWLLPVFIVLLGFHLWMLLKKVRVKGYGPFVISLIGFSILIPSKLLFDLPEGISIVGMLFIFIGSLWNSFTINKTQKLLLN